MSGRDPTGDAFLHAGDDALVEPLAQGLRQQIGASRYDLVGFSLGSVVATMLAVHDHAAVRKLVLAAPHALLRIPRETVSSSRGRP